MKTCFKCGKSKPRAEFYVHSEMGDGLLGKCKDCACRDVRENREKRKDYYDKKDRERAHLKYPRKAKYQKDRRGIRVAHRILHKALADGFMKRESCRECGEGNAHGHHEDYGKPLVVVWLCQKHHRRRHSQMKKDGINIYNTIPREPAR